MSDALSIPPPSIILIRPQMGENIGAAARAMKNFGLSDLRLVAPRDGWPNERAHEMAAHGDSIIEQATIYPTLLDALGECDYVLGTSDRGHHTPLPAYAPRNISTLAQEHHAQHMALVFGPENHGMSNEDMSYCHGLITIDAHPDYTSLNLAQSIVICAYEWFASTTDNQHSMQQHDNRATISELEALQATLCSALNQKHYFRSPNKKPAIEQRIRHMLRKHHFSSSEIHAIHGMIRALNHE